MGEERREGRRKWGQGRQWILKRIKSVLDGGEGQPSELGGISDPGKAGLPWPQGRVQHWDHEPRLQSLWKPQCTHLSPNPSELRSVLICRKEVR